MPDPLPPLSVDDLLRMIGERDVRIEQLARRVEALEAERHAPPRPVEARREP